jgi:hypothetical protein
VFSIALFVKHMYRLPRTTALRILVRLCLCVFRARLSCVRCVRRLGSNLSAHIVAATAAATAPSMDC